MLKIRRFKCRNSYVLSISVNIFVEFTGNEDFTHVVFFYKTLNLLNLVKNRKKE